VDQWNIQHEKLLSKLTRPTHCAGISSLKQHRPSVCKWSI